MARRGLIAFAGLCLALMLGQTASAASAPGCGRQCLASFLERYLAALTAHDPAKAPLDFTFRQTQNAVVIPRGEGLWRDAVGLGPVQRRFFDPSTGTAAYFGMLTLTGGEPAIAALRLHVKGGRLDEAEWHVTRASDPGITGPAKAVFDAPNLIANPPPDRTVAGADRLPREALVSVVNSYFDGITSANPRVIMAHPGCTRFENGVKVTGRQLPPERAAEGPGGKSDCTSGQGRFGISLVSGRRYPMVDQEAQVVLAIGTFIRKPNEPRRRNHFMEFFFIDHAKIRDVYAAFIYPDPSQPVPNWPPYEGNFPLPADFGVAK